MYAVQQAPPQITLSQAERKIIRSAAGIRRYTSIPVEVVVGDDAPHETGESWHYRTRGGSYISHPSAYSRTGWSNMVYHSSTRRVEVGEKWVLTQRRMAAWPKSITQTLAQFAERLKEMVDSLGPVDRLTLDIGYPYGTWRRCPMKRRVVLHHVRRMRSAK